MTTINEISNHIMSYFDGTLDAFGYTAQSVNEISNPDESYMIWELLISNSGIIP